MHIFKEIGPLKAHLKHARSTQSSIGFVPTMGALHPGHLSLIEASRRENTLTISSIYVNPTQFNNPGDLAKYPRTLEQDFSLLRETGCDVVFCPDNEQMYTGVSKLTFGFGGLDTVLEGEFRPGHFSGVALVVSKLFHIVQPDRAYFGQKDYQQFKIILRMVEELKMDVSLICRPIVREEDGLAMSSRNKRLVSEERNRAVILYQSLKEARIMLMHGESLQAVQKMVKELCEQHGSRLEYLALADTENFKLLNNVVSPERSILLIAAYVGDVRLIDNLLISDYVS
jgi:pantoate--beta-alanine ligase